MYVCIYIYVYIYICIYIYVYIHIYIYTHIVDSAVGARLRTNNYHPPPPLQSPLYSNSDSNSDVEHLIL